MTSEREPCRAGCGAGAAPFDYLGPRLEPLRARARERWPQSAPVAREGRPITWDALRREPSARGPRARSRRWPGTRSRRRASAVRAGDDPHPRARPAHHRRVARRGRVAAGQVPRLAPDKLVEAIRYAAGTDARLTELSRALTRELLATCEETAPGRGELVAVRLAELARTQAAGGSLERVLRGRNRL